MSLDVSLITDEKPVRFGTGVYVREGGKTIELTPEQVFERFPETTDVTVYKIVDDEVFTANITHNMGEMAQRADLYTALWRPDEQGWERAKDITGMLRRGLKRLKKDPELFKKYNPDNGWGSYEGLVEFVENYLEACEKYPEAKIEVSR